MMTDREREVIAAARELYEQVECDEVIGVCLSDRVAALRLGAALVALDSQFTDDRPDPNACWYCGLMNPGPEHNAHACYEQRCRAQEAKRRTIFDRAI